MKLFDSHAHLDFKFSQDKVKAMLDRSWEAGMVGIMTMATRVGEYELPLEILKLDRRLWMSAGIHPHSASQASASGLDKLRFVLDNERVMALGEIGLDYHYNHSTPAEQRKAFISQIRMAHDVNLPVVIHTREADNDTTAIMKDEGAQHLGGVIHCFSSGQKLADSVLVMGFYLSFSGIVTFPSAKEVQQVACSAPLEKIMAETDSPFLSPIPFRGKTNEPARVLHVVEKLAEIRKIVAEELGEILAANTCKCFRINEEALAG